MNKKLVGPMWPDIAAKKYSAKRIMELVKKPEPANWPGYVPMLAQSTVPKAELTKIANWLSKLK
jgi:cytochrome c551/c552